MRKIYDINIDEELEKLSERAAKYLAAFGAVFWAYIAVVFLIGPLISVYDRPQVLVYAAIGWVCSRTYFEFLGYQQAVIPPYGEAIHLTKREVLFINRIYILRIVGFYEIVIVAFAVLGWEYFLNIGQKWWMAILQMQAMLPFFAVSQSIYALQFYNGKWKKKQELRAIKEEIREKKIEEKRQKPVC